MGDAHVMAPSTWDHEIYVASKMKIKISWSYLMQFQKQIEQFGIYLFKSK